MSNLQVLPALDELSDEPVLVLRLPEESSLVGKTISESHMSGLMGIMIIGILRDEKIKWSVSPDEILKANDRLFVSGEKEKFGNASKDR